MVTSIREKGFRLVVAEKPSVARDIARVLQVGGRGAGVLGQGELRVTWCVGHLVELAEPGEYDDAWRPWRLDVLPMMPQEFKLRPRGEGKDQWEVLRKLFRNPALAAVVNACDAGREGELIFSYVYELSRCRAPVERLWISSMTDASIRAGFKNLRPGSELRHLEAAARCRSQADWLVGINATRAMTIRARRGDRSNLLSLGRVQTPTLALLDEREEAIESFEPKPFWQVKVRLAAAGDQDAQPWEATWIGGKDGRQDRLDTEGEAQAIVERIAGLDGVVSRAQRKQTRERAPLIYDLTTLQKEGNRRFRFTAQRTLDIAQALYEKHKLLTYPRTDSRHLGQDQVGQLEGIIRSVAFPPYEPVANEVLDRWPVQLGTRVVDDREVSDHHGIIPTGQDARRRSLSVDEKRVFDLVVRRFLAVFLPDAVFATALLEATIAKDRFVARGRTLVDPGWQRIDPPAQKKGKKKPAEPQLPLLDRGAEVRQLGHRIQEGVTKPPPRYTEATLLGAMERAGDALEEAELKRAMKRKGLGTPATRAAVIETLLRRRYIERQEGRLVPAPAGRALLKALPVPALRSPRLTGEWEARLTSVAEGAELPDVFMKDIRIFVREAVEHLVHADMVPPMTDLEVRPQTGPVLGSCPRCGGDVAEGPRGWGCGGCPLFIRRTIAGREVSTRMARQLLTQGRTAVVKGFTSRKKKTFQAGLTLDSDGGVAFFFPEAPSLGDCPLCRKAVRNRRKVFTCESGRDCPFVVFPEMAGQTITEEAVQAMLSNGRSDPIEGFGRPDGKPFTGVLEWRDSRVVVTPYDARQDSGSAGSCPSCNGQVHFARERWRCDGCSLSLPGDVAGRTLQAGEIGELLSTGRTGRLHGFRQKNGAVFKAGLVRTPEGRVELDFHAPDDGRRIRSGPPPAFGRPVDCPRCVGQALPDAGYIVAGRAAWGCSRWRDGCHLQVPFVIHGATLPDDEAQRLFSSKKATRYLEEPIGEQGRRMICRVVLLPENEPCWKLEPRRRVPRR